MTVPYRFKPSSEPPIKLKASTEPKLAPAEVAAALGAVSTEVTIPPGGSPMTKFAARREAYLGLQDAVAVSARVTSDRRWQLHDLVTRVTRDNFLPSTEYVAGVLLTWALERVAAGELPDALKPPAAPPPAAG